MRVDMVDQAMQQCVVWRLCMQRNNMQNTSRQSSATSEEYDSNIDRLGPQCTVKALCEVVSTHALKSLCRL